MSMTPDEIARVRELGRHHVGPDRLLLHHVADVLSGFTEDLWEIVVTEQPEIPCTQPAQQVFLVRAASKARAIEIVRQQSRPAWLARATMEVFRTAAEVIQIGARPRL